MTDLTPCARGCRMPGVHTPGAHPDGPRADNCPGCVHRPAKDGLTICGECFARAQTALLSLADLWPDLQAGISRPKNYEPGASIHTSDLVTVGDMWRPAVSQLVTDLRDWIEYVARIAEPAGRIRRLHLTQLAPSVALAAIARQLYPLLALHPALDASLVDDVLTYRRRADDGLASGYMRRIPLGKRCPRTRFEDVVLPSGETVAQEVPCGHELVAVLIAADLGRDSTIQCSRYPRDHVFPQTEWGELDEKVEALQT